MCRPFTHSPGWALVLFLVHGLQAGSALEPVEGEVLQCHLCNSSSSTALSGERLHGGRQCHQNNARLRINSSPIRAPGSLPCSSLPELEAPNFRCLWDQGLGPLLHLPRWGHSSAAAASSCVRLSLLLPVLQSKSSLQKLGGERRCRARCCGGGERWSYH